MRFIYNICFCVITALLMPLTMMGQTADEGEIKRLQTEMYRLFYQEDSLAFRQTVSELMDATKKSGNDELFYRAWGNNSIYESTHQRRTHALEIAREMEAYAKAHKSIFGQYTAMHVTGTVYQQMRDYENAERTFKEAIDFLHKYAPGQSAAADYIELVLLSVNGQRDAKQGMAYAEMTLKEPNLSDQHRMRVLTLLCQLEGTKINPDREVFNRYYEERLQARKGTPADASETLVNLLYSYVNGDYERALMLTDSLPGKDQAVFARARIFHAMGDDTKAFEEMLDYRSVRDSINLAERSGLLSEYIMQLNNERLELKNKELEEQNAKLVTAIVFLLGALLVALLVWTIWRRVKLTRKLRYELDLKRDFVNNLAKRLRTPLNPITGFSNILASGDVELSPEEREMMNHNIQDGTKMLTGIIDNVFELSYYESRQKLDKTDTFHPNLVCQNAIDQVVDNRKKSGVEVKLVTELPDDLVITSDQQSVSKVLTQLLDNGVKYTDAGEVVLNCVENNDRIRFTVSDTGQGIPPEWRKHVFEPMVITRGSAKSSGMDLAICKSVTKLLGGDIWLDESYTNGSRFVFEIPKE